MFNLEAWMAALGALVRGLLGARGEEWFDAYPWAFGLAALAIVLIPGCLVVVMGVRILARLARDASRNFRLLLTPQGRHGLRLARQIRQGARRLRHILATAEGDPREHRALLRMIERFTEKDLPEALAQAETFIETGGDRRAEDLARELARQEQVWAAAPPGEARERLQREIAETRQVLAQTRHSNEHRERVLKGLEEAALALRTLEVETVSLEVTRSHAAADLRDNLSDVAETLRHQREAHRRLEEGH